MRTPPEIAKSCVRAWYDNAGENGEDWGALEAVIAEVQQEAHASGLAAGRAEALQEAAAHIGGLADSDQYGGSREQLGLYAAAAELRALAHPGGGRR